MTLNTKTKISHTQIVKKNTYRLFIIVVVSILSFHHFRDLIRNDDNTRTITTGNICNTSNATFNGNIAKA